MVIMTKEQSKISQEVLDQLKNTADLLDQVEQQIRNAQPDTPDGSGGKGKYSTRLTKFFGRPVYQTENNVIFYHNGENGKIISDDHVNKARKHFLETENYDILNEIEEE